MSLRSLTLKARMDAVEKAIRNRFVSVEVKRNIIGHIDVDGKSGLQLSITVRPFLHGKPSIRYLRERDRGAAEVLAYDLRRAGLYLFLPRVEQIRE